MEGHVVENEININSGKKYDDDILNQSYEDIYSINEKKNAIEKLDDGNIYQGCGQSGDVNLAVNKNGEKIGIAKYNKNEAPTRNCLNYAFLASCGERTPQILDKRKGVAVFSVDKKQEVDFEVQSFFPNDGENNYFSPNAENVKMFVPYDSLDYTNRELYGFMIKDRTKEVIICRSQYLSPNTENKLAGYGSYLYTWHILTECGDEPKTEFIDHFATLFADELCFDIQDRNCGNILVIPSKNENRRDIVNIDVDFGWQKKISSRCYLEFYLIAKEVTFKFGEKLNEGYMDGHVNKNLNEKYKPRNSKVNFKFQPKQKLKIPPEIIVELDKKIIEKIEQRLNFSEDKFVQYYIDNCIRRGDIDQKTAFSDFQEFMKSLYEYIKQRAEALKTDKNFDHFSKPFNDFMKKYQNYEGFNGLSEKDFSEKWAEREQALKNPKKIEKKKVNEDKQKIKVECKTETMTNEGKIIKENEITKEKGNETSGRYLMKWILIILGLLLIAGGIALFFVAPTLAFKIFAIGLGILGVAGFGFGLFYNGIGDYYRKKTGILLYKFFNVYYLGTKTER